MTKAERQQALERLEKDRVVKQIIDATGWSRETANRLADESPEKIAKAIKISGKQPLRNIIFAFWDGEEKGLLGSAYFVENWKEKEKIKSYMNFDMVGRGPVDNPSYLKYFYTASHPQFGEWLRKDMAKRNFCFTPDYISWDEPYSGSDNAPFARAGVPIVWYHTDGHPDYHNLTDTADKIDYPKLLDIIRAAYLCVWRMANE